MTIPVHHEGVRLGDDDSTLRFCVAVVGDGGHVLVACVTAYEDMIAVGSLRWVAGESGMIGYVWVPKEHRRKKIATRLLKAAELAARQQGWAAPQHSDSRSEIGNAWPMSIGATSASDVYSDDPGGSARSGAPVVPPIAASDL
jgi:GNAT superfamily N-acetyltransferase